MTKNFNLKKSEGSLGILWILIIVVALALAVYFYAYRETSAPTLNNMNAPASTEPADETAVLEQELQVESFDGLDAELKDIDNELASEGGAADRTPTSAPQLITIKNFAFSPAEIRIKAGTNVNWGNEDSVGHTVTSDSNAFRESPLLAKGETYNLNFNQKGTFTYHCAPHPNMKAKVIVE